jgi:hypothetical protein
MTGAHPTRSAAPDEEVPAATKSLGAAAGGNRLSVRWNLIKLIQEYARHNGHADLIRQRIDGATGE